MTTPGSQVGASSAEATAGLLIPTATDVTPVGAARRPRPNRGDSLLILAVLPPHPPQLLTYLRVCRPPYLIVTHYFDLPGPEHIDPRPLTRLDETPDANPSILERLSRDPG